MVSSGLLRRVALVGTDVSEEPGASFIFIVTAVKTSNLTQRSSCRNDNILMSLPSKIANVLGIV
jgi:hypothetical protein